VPVTSANYGDLVTQTLADLGRGKFTDLMSSYQKTIALKRIVKKEKVQFQSGKSLSFNAITNHNNSARGVGLGYTSVVNLTSSTIVGEVDWRHQHWNYAWEHRAIDMNRDPAKIVDLLQTSRIQGIGAGIIYFEERMWRVPPITNTVDFYGIPYWVVKSNTATTTNDGFNGLAPSGYTTVGGIDPATNTRWRNYATQYTTVSKDDAIRKMRRMLEYTDFEPLVDEIPEYNLGDDMAIYTNYAVKAAMEEILEAQNENLGTDVASMDGKATFHRTPITSVKELDLDTTNPIYSINWGELFWAFLKGWYMKETTFDKSVHQPTMGVTFTDNTGNTFCRNRRRQGVISTNTTMSY
jgi:hypothetical protein